MEKEHNLFVLVSLPGDRKIKFHMLLWERVEGEPCITVKVGFRKVAYVKPNVVWPLPGPCIARA